MVCFTVDTLAYLKLRFRNVCFVWIMGADHLDGFNRWRGWRRIARMMPMAIIDRPGWTIRAVRSRSAAALSASRIPEAGAMALPELKPPAWVFLHGPRSHLSSTKLRQMRRTSPLGGR